MYTAFSSQQPLSCMLFCTFPPPACISKPWQDGCLSVQVPPHTSSFLRKEFLLPLFTVTCSQHSALLVLEELTFLGSDAVKYLLTASFLQVFVFWSSKIRAASPSLMHKSARIKALSLADMQSVCGCSEMKGFVPPANFSPHQNRPFHTCDNDCSYLHESQLLH